MDVFASMCVKVRVHFQENSHITNGSGSHQCVGVNLTIAKCFTVSDVKWVDKLDEGIHGKSFK